MHAEMWVEVMTEMRAQVVASHPLPENAFVYVNFNSYQKIEPQLFQAWMDIVSNVVLALFCCASRCSAVCEICVCHLCLLCTQTRCVLYPVLWWTSVQCVL